MPSAFHKFTAALDRCYYNIPSEERPREPPYLACSCTDGERLNWDSNPDLPVSGIDA